MHDYDARRVSQTSPEDGELEKIVHPDGESLCERLSRLDSELEIERADVGARGEGFRMPPVLEVTVPKSGRWSHESGTGPPPDRG